MSRCRRWDWSHITVTPAPMLLRLIADTFLDVVADLGQAAESDEMAAVGPSIERVNSRFFHVTDLVARNKMVAGPEMSGPSPANQLFAAPPPAAVEPTSANVIDQAMAIQQFGGDTNFFRRMSVKFIASVSFAVDYIWRRTRIAPHPPLCAAVLLFCSLIVCPSVPTPLHVGPWRRRQNCGGGCRRFGGYPIRRLAA